MKRRKLLTVAQMDSEVKAFVSLCLAVIWENNADNKDPKEVSNATGLSLSTIYRIYRGYVSCEMRFSTLSKLGNAAGLKLEMSRNGSRLVAVG